MKKAKYLSIMILALLWASAAYSQDHSTEMRVYFRLNSTEIDSTYMDNAAHLHEIATTLRGISQDSTANITNVSLCGAASPDGTYEINRKMAQNRLSALEKFVRQQVDLPDSVITREDSYILWDKLKSQIEQSGLEGKEEAIEIIEEEPQLVAYSKWSRIDNRIVKLQKIGGGKFWQEIKEHNFDSLRNACAVVITYKKEVPVIPEPVEEPVEEVVEEPVEAVEEVAEEPVEAAEEPASDEKEWHRHLDIKTNAIGWGLAIANLGVEIDLGRHWSFTLPIYFSSWDYFKSDIKFNTFAIQPEVRYWFSVKDQCNNGWFAGAHFGMAYYNLAAGGDYRYQDCSRETPALGGGLALGYRMPIGKKNHWRVEFTLGGGCYKLEYDKFYNVKNGLLVESGIEKTYWGLDMAAINFSYSFDLNKKKGGAR